MSTEIGHRAETIAAEYLQRLGYNVMEQNWRTRWCEIDIVARHGKIMYFVEVKYRRTSHQGGGLDYITPRKLAQMQFAAAFWMSLHNNDADYRLAVVEVSGADYKVSAWIDELT